MLCANNVSELGGAQNVVHTLARTFAQRGHTVHVVGVTPHEHPHAFDTAGYSVHTLMDSIWPLKTDPNAGERTALRAQAVSNFAALLGALAADSDRPPCVIAAQLFSLEILRDSLPARSPWRVISQYHGSFAAAAGGRDLRRVLTHVPATELFTVLSEEDATAFAGAGLTNVTTMANPWTLWPVDDALPPNPQPTFDFIGRLSPEKGPDLLLDAWKAIESKVDPRWRLRFIGTGPAHEQIRAAATGHRVDFLDPLVDISPLLMSAGAVVLPSRTEGAPLVLAEALSAGVPVIVSDCSSGVREMIAGTNQAVLVERENVAALASALLAFAAEYHGEVSDQRALPTHQQITAHNNAVALRWENIFDRVSS